MSITATAQKISFEKYRKFCFVRRFSIRFILIPAPIDAPEHIVNVPLPAGTDSQAFRAAVESHWLPKLEAFQPELILISAGFDAHIEDDMAGLQLVDQDFAWVTSEIKTIADKYAKGRIVSTLEGGYALSALGRSVAAHINALLG